MSCPLFYLCKHASMNCKRPYLCSTHKEFEKWIQDKIDSAIENALEDLQ